MKYLFSFSVLALGLLLGCQHKSTNRITANESDALAQLEEIALALKAKAEEPTDYPLAQSLVDKSLDFALVYKDSEELPAVLFRAGEVARSIQNYEQAIAIFSRIYTDFSKSPLAVNALFLEASTFEDCLKDKSQAQLRYQQLIEKHPDHLLAEQARLLIKNINKTPEELIREFEKNK